MKIITFCCSSAVHVYYENAGVIPREPLKQHRTINEAIDYLKERGVRNVEIIENGTNRPVTKDLDSAGC